MHPRTEQLIRDYLNRVSVAARGRLDADDRRAFLARTREFIEQNTRALGKADAADVNQLLTRLGDPAMLVDRESDRLAARRLAGDPVPDPPVFLAQGSASKAVGPRPARPRRWRQARGALAGLMTSSATLVPPSAERPPPEPADDAPAPSASRAPSGEMPPAPPAAGSEPRTHRPQWPWLDPGQPAATDVPANGAAPGTTANGTAAHGAAASAGTLANGTAVTGSEPDGVLAEAAKGTQAPDAEPGGTEGTGLRDVTAFHASEPDDAAPGGPGSSRSRRPRTGRAVGSVADVVRGTGWARGVRHRGPEPSGSGADQGTGTGGRGQRPVRPPRRYPVSEGSAPGSGGSAAGEAPFGEPGLGLGLPPGSLAAARDRAGQVIRAVTIWARKRPLETTAVVLLGLGGLIFPPVWLLGALVALGSKVWDHRDKWIGLVLPVFVVIAGMAAAVSLGGPHHGVSGYAKEAWLFGDHLSRIVAVLGAVYLTWRAERGPRRPAVPPWTRGGRLG